MPRLNAVLMVVLAVAVIATAGFLSIEKSPPAPEGPDPKETGLLLRKLGDNDPDLRREAESKFRSMGNRAVEPLREAAKSNDPALAGRAAKLLREIEPPPAEAPAVVAENGAPEAPKVEIVEFVLESRGGQVRAVEVGGLWVQFRNNGPAPVLVGHAIAIDHPEMAVFQVEDASGRRSDVPAEIVHLRPTDIEERVSVRPREAAVLFQGGTRLVEAVAKPGTYKIRFFYDARPAGAYRRLVQASAEGALLPPVRLASNAITVTVAE